MKKLFTFIFAAALGIGSCWGTDITIGSGISGNTGVPVSYTNKYELVQLFITASQMGNAESCTITSISFRYKGSVAVSRTMDIYLENTKYTSFASSKYEPIIAANKVYSGTVTTPSSSGWYTITLSTPYNYIKGKNVLLTIYDYTGTSTNEQQHYSFSPAGNSLHKSSTTAIDITASNIVGTGSTIFPQIKFSTGSTPTPTITVPSSVSLGTFDAQYEKDSTTFLVKGSDLKGDVTLSAGAGLEVFPTSITKEAITAAGSTGVSVKVRSTNAFAFNSPKVTISSQDATSQTVTINGTQAEYVAQISVPALYNTTDGSYSTLAGPTEIASVDASAQTFVIGSGSQACTIDYSAVPDTYVAHGKVSNLKVKKTGTGLFKAFAFSYSATGITIDEIKENNQITYGTTANVTLNRTLVADGYYSTICLPFAVTAEQIADQFGEGTVVQELTEASLSDNDNELTLTFEERDTIGAGKPYLINPKRGGSSFIFNNVTLDNTDRSYKSTNLDFIGTFDKINLTVGNKNTLLLGAENGLGWAETSGAFKGLRAYFLVTYHGASAPARLNTRMVFNNTTKIQEIQSEATPMSDVHKFVNNGQLIIIRNGVKYNAQGARL